MIPADDTESLVLRPWRQWAVLGPVIVTLIFYAVCMAMLVGPGGVMTAAPLLVYVAVVLTGRAPWVRTTVNAKGIAWRRAWTSARLPWREIAEIAVTPRGPAAGFGLVVTTRTGRRAPLPAPTFGTPTSEGAMAAQVEAILAKAGAHRDRIVFVPLRPWGRRAAVVGHAGLVGVLGLVCALCLYLASPWTAGWWPGRNEAARLPAPCSVVDEAAVARIAPGARPEPVAQAGEERRECFWAAGDDSVLSVHLEMQGRGPDGGASERARVFYASRAEGCSAPVPGLGDEACVEKPGHGVVRLVAREANVLVTVVLSVDLPDGESVREARGLAAGAIGAIEFE
ncbi:PH domain-containing protein [Actinomadura sediminis]|uniref:PH domain-containing protein n=1 Tax=Actinomadura sediminis TaxID=1038904 RepID=A0ABW3EQJ5_9ACTN